MYSDSGFESDSSISTAFSTSSGGYDSEAGHPEPAAPRAPWRCDPAFGVVHQERCGVCRHYMSHFVQGSRASHDASFQAAIRERDGKVTMRFFEGIEEGRRLQGEKDRAKVSRYRDEREEERSRRHRTDAEVKRLRAELAEMRDAFMAMQITYEDQITALTFGPTRIEDDLEALRMMELQNALFNESRRHDSHYEEEEVLAIAGPSGWNSEPDDLFDTDSSGDLGPESDAAVKVLEWPSSDTSADVQHPAPKEVIEETDLSADEAKALMNELSQNPTNAAASLRIRDLFKNAHSIPEKRRTSAQRFVIREAWKLPTILGSTRAPTIATLPEIFVDASVQGIGFLWDSRWSAWKLDKAWRTDGRDMPWAEMVAVELGLRTLIAAGIHSTHIRVRSDNHAVITALTSRRAPKSPQDALILQEILKLCQAYGIVLMPVWIWTKSNPADALSRGRYPRRDLYVDVPADIPPHLQPYVRDIQVASA